MSDKGFQQCHDAARFGKASNTEMMIGQNYIGLRYENGEDDLRGEKHPTRGLVNQWHIIKLTGWRYATKLTQ